MSFGFSEEGINQGPILRAIIIICLMEEICFILTSLFQVILFVILFFKAPLHATKMWSPSIFHSHNSVQLFFYSEI